MRRPDIANSTIVRTIMTDAIVQKICILRLCFEENILFEIVEILWIIVIQYNYAVSVACVRYNDQIARYVIF